MTNIDMRKTVVPKSDQLNADDLIGRSLTIKITKVTGNEEDPQQPVSFHYDGDNGKPYKPCKTMRRLIIHAWKHETKDYAGRSMTLYCDPEVTFGGMKVGGIRISHLSHISGNLTVALTSAKAKKKAVTVQPLPTDGGGAAASAPAADPALVAAGNEAAGKGVTAYVAWRDALPAAQKESIRLHNSEWSKLAKEFDASHVKADLDDEIPV